ncbi:MAG: FKBP-type peptidyl-prolyl cis-trans isomerase [Bernardetiaceae bacterium]
MKTLFLLIAMTFAYSHVQAQCEDCPTSDFAADRCFTDENYPELCVQFAEKSPVFLFQRKKKSLEISEKLELLDLAKNKSYKLTAVEILFLQAAKTYWNQEKMNIGYQMQPSGLGIKIVEEGSGPMPEAGKEVIVHYTGKLTDGTTFDSSIERGEPFSFPLGQGRVIKGWDEGIAALKVGSKAWLKIPPELGYGARGAGGVIPPNATLLFYVEVVGVK